MRIVAGRFSGRRIATPPGSATRPTSDRVRESLFASLESLNMLAGATVLDVFAGSGALGLEALSRGAAHVTFVEKAHSAAEVVAGNIRTLTGAAPGAAPAGGQASAGDRAAQPGAAALEAQTRLLTASAPGILRTLPAGGTDLVFADPPYPLKEPQITALLEAIAPLLRDDSSLVVLERSTRSPTPTLPIGLREFRHRTHGETALWLLERERGVSGVD